MDFIRWQQAVGKSSVHEITDIHCVYNWDSYMCSRINTTKTTQKTSMSDEFLSYNWDVT